MKTHTPLRSMASAVVLCSLLWVTGCDSSDDGPGISAVAGDYNFEQFRFVSSSSFPIEVNLLEDLAAADTRMTLVTRERYTLLYRFTGKNIIVVDGTFSFKGNRVSLRGQEEDASLYKDVLLPLEFSFTFDEAEPALLRASIRESVNLEAFDKNRFEGLREVGGTIELVLRRR